MFTRWTSVTLLRWCFWSCAAVVLVLALVPPKSYLPSTPWDKANHALAFATLAALGIWSYRGSIAGALLGLLAYGGMIELLQALTPYHTAEWGDWLADAVGLVIGWQLTRVLARVRKVSRVSDAHRQPRSPPG